MAEKVTTMVLKVDLNCPCCYKKIQKLLSKFPQIRDQIYDGKQNRVTITVVSCSPQKIRDKLSSKGCKIIKSIAIKDPDQKHKSDCQTQKEPAKASPHRAPIPVLVYPVRPCCGPYCVGCPCNYYGFGNGMPVPCYGYGENRSCYASPCDYFSEANTAGCSIM